MIHAYANNINTEEGGTHLTGFKNALTKVINDYGVKNKILREMKSYLAMMFVKVLQL
jgi:DNA gyrase subunit B